MTLLGRICNPTAPNISICNAATILFIFCVTYGCTTTSISPLSPQ